MPEKHLPGYPWDFDPSYFQTLTGHAFGTLDALEHLSMKSKIFVALLLFVVCVAFTIVVRAEKGPDRPEIQSHPGAQAEQMPSFAALSLVREFFPPAREESYLLLAGGVFLLLGIVLRKRQPSDGGKTLTKLIASPVAHSTEQSAS